MSIQNEIINTEVRTTGAKSTQDDILKVNQTIHDLVAEEGRLLMVKTKLESQRKKDTEALKQNKEAIDLNRAAQVKQREELTKLNSQIKISEMSYNQLSKRAAELRGKMNNVSKELHPEKWNSYNKELSAVNGQMQKVRAGTQQTSTVMGTLSKAAGLLGIGFVSVTGAMRAGKEIISATQFTADAFDKTMAGLKQTVSNFFIAISSGDWSNFREGLRKSREAAEDLEETMDVLGDIRRGLSIEEAKMENRKDEILRQLRDKTGQVTIAQKKKLYVELLDIDNNYNNKVLAAAKRERDGILNLYSSITGLSNSQIEEIISNYSDYEKRFNDAADNLSKARKAAFGESKIGDVSKKVFDQEAYLKGLSDVDRMFTQLYLNYGKLNDSNLDRLTGSIIAVEKATGASTRTQLENVRVYNEIFREKTENSEKEVTDTVKRDEVILESKKGLSGRIRQIEQSDADFIIKLREDLEKRKKELTDDEAKLFEEAMTKKDEFLQDYETKSLKEIRDMKMAELKSRYKEVMEYEQLTNEERIKLTEEFEEAKDAIETEYWDGKLAKLQEQTAQINGLFTASADFANALRENEISNIEDDYAKKIKLAGNDKTKVAKLEEEKEKKIKAVKKQYADVDFHLKVLQINASTAQAIMSVWGNNTLPYPFAAVFNGIMSAVITATGVAQVVAASSARNKAKSLHTGGYTGDGDKYTPAGVVHKGEYVVAQEELEIPAVRSYIGNIVEPFRMKRLGYSSYAQDTTISGRGYANGGMVTPGGGIDVNTLNNMQSTMAQIGIFLRDLKQSGVNANFDQSKILEMRQEVAKQEVIERRARR